MLKPGWIVAFSAALVACAPRTVEYRVAIVTRACDERVDPLEGVRFLRLRVTGEGLARGLEATAALGAGHLVLPEIPAGDSRVLEVRAYDGEPTAGGRVVSLGRSAPFAIPDVLPVEAPPAISVFLRRVNAFTPPASASGGACERMKVARAGHTATRLQDGRVLIAGGFALSSRSGPRRALADAELFDPATGTFASVRELSVMVGGESKARARAYHAAVLVPESGQVALWGGETYPEDGGAPVPQASILFYDSAADEYLALSAPAASPRAHHGVAVDVTGHLFAAGGVGAGGKPATAVEWITPTSAEHQRLDGVALPRLDATVGTLAGAEVVAVAGGTDGLTLRTEVALFRFAGGSFTEAGAARLGSLGRRAATGASLRGGTDLVLLGGYSDPVAVRPLASTEILSGPMGIVSSGPNITALGEVCAAPLSDGRVVILGGRTADEAQGQPRSSAETMVMSAGAQGAVSILGGPDLPTPRHAHTCTPLLDGTVLITGGIDEGAGLTTLDDAWIYQPTPLD